MIESKYLKDNVQNIQKLMSIPPLRKFETESLRQLIRLAKLREYEPGEIVIEEGGEDPYVYFLLSGKVKVQKKGVPIILDATNLSERYQERLYSIAYRLDVKLILVRTEAPSQVVQERLEARVADPKNKSDADWKVYQQMKPRAQKIGRNHYVVDTSRDITPVLDKIVREVRR